MRKSHHLYENNRMNHQQLKNEYDQDGFVVIRQFLWGEQFENLKNELELPA